MNGAWSGRVDGEFSLSQSIKGDSALLNLSTGTILSLVLPLVALELILIIVALVDLVRREPGRVNGSKTVWVLIIVLIATIGPICYFILGRKE
jgi:Phospholipase_D-nuclease N-terminal